MLPNNLITKETVILITFLEKIISMIVLFICALILLLIYEESWIINLIKLNQFSLHYIFGSLWLAFSIIVLLIKDQKINFDKFKTIFFNKSILFLLKNFLIILGITILSCSCMISSYFFIGYAILKSLPIIQFIQKIPIVMLAASLPISINGWGVRELAAIKLFNKINILSSDALIISALFGLLNIVVIIVSSCYQYYFNRNISKKITINDNYIYNKSINYTNIFNNILIILFCLGFFINYKLYIHNTYININIFDLISIYFSLIFVTSNYSKLITTKIFFIFIITSLLLLISLITGYLSFGSNAWAWYNKFLGWFVLWSYAFTGMQIFYNSTNKQYYYWLKLLVYIAVSVLLYDIVILFISIALRKTFSHHTSLDLLGLLNNSNAFSYLLCIIFSILTIYGTRWFSKTKFIVVYGFILVSNILTHSRTGLISIIVLCLLGITLNCIYLNILLLAILVSIFCISIVHTFPLIVKMFSPATPILSSSIINTVLDTASYSIVERWRTITEGLQMWYSHPILGEGLGAYINKETVNNNVPLLIHNTYVWILAEFGTIGFSLYIALLVLLIYKIFLLYRDIDTKQESLLLLLLLINFSIFTLAHEMLYQRIHWFLIAYILSKSLATRNRSSYLRSLQPVSPAPH